MFRLQTKDRYKAESLSMDIKDKMIEKNIVTLLFTSQLVVT